MSGDSAVSPGSTNDLLRRGAAALERNRLVREGAKEAARRAQEIMRQRRRIRGGSDGGAAESAPSRRNRPTPTVVTQYALLQATLRVQPRQWFCSTCLGGKLGLRPGVVMMLAIRLEGHPDFRRSYQECAQCGRSRLVSAFIGPADGHETAAAD